MIAFLSTVALALFTALLPYIHGAPIEDVVKRQFPPTSYIQVIAPSENISPQASQIAASLQGKVSIRTHSFWL